MNVDDDEEVDDLHDHFYDQIICRRNITIHFYSNLIRLFFISNNNSINFLYRNKLTLIISNNNFTAYIDTSI
jgi:hypothetical protein